MCFMIPIFDVSLCVSHPPSTKSAFCPPGMSRTPDFQNLHVNNPKPSVSPPSPRPSSSSAKSYFHHQTTS